MHTRREPISQSLLPPWWRLACAGAAGVVLLLVGGQALFAPDSLFTVEPDGPIGHYVRDAAALHMGLGLAAVVAAARPRLLPGAMSATGASSALALASHAADAEFTWDMPALLLVLLLSAAAVAPGPAADGHRP